MNESPWEGMTIEEEIGFGAYGTVYRVLLNGNEYAMKQIRIRKDPESGAVFIPGTAVTADDTGVDPIADFYMNEPDSCLKAHALQTDLAEELLEEIRILQKFRSHPNIVYIQDYQLSETEDGLELSFLMECLVPFSEYETTHPMNEPDVIRLGIDMCQALEACEKESILHRDLKIDNVLVSPDGTFKLCDFGTARILEKTISDMSVKGTFSFMAPEVYHGKKYDHRADIYSLGMILYRTLNRGREPFLSQEIRMVRYKDREDALNRRMNGEALPAPVDASKELTEILMKACAYYPEKRYSTAAELKEDLTRLQNGFYKKKKNGANKYRKRDRIWYRRAAMIAVCILAVCAAAAAVAVSWYRTHVVNYCDAAIQKEQAQEYGFTPGARLDGNGVLYISSNEDLYCTIPDGRYPWMNQKDRIKKIVFGEDVTDIEANRYMLVAQFQDGLMPVSDDIFRYCSNLQEIEIRSKAIQIGGNPGMFVGDESLRVITSAPDAEIIIPDISLSGLFETAWAAEDGYRMLGSTLVKYNGSDPVIDKMPENIERIADSVFQDHIELQKIVLPSHTHEIGANVFYGCAGLETIVLPEELEQIGSDAFNGCTSLEKLVIPEGVNAIAPRAFCGCSALRDLTVSPENHAFVMDNGVLYSADRTVLLWCSPALSGTLSVPEGVVNIYGGALNECLNLKALILPGSVSEAGELFGACPNLAEIRVSENCPAFSLTDGNMLLNGAGNQLLLTVRKTAEQVVVPEGVQAVMGYAFAYCRDVTDIILPDSAVYIGSYVFENCTSLERIRIPADISMIGSDAFAGCENLEDVYFAGSEEAWIAATDRHGIDLPGTAVVHFEAE